MVSFFSQARDCQFVKMDISMMTLDVPLTLLRHLIKIKQKDQTMSRPG